MINQLFLSMLWYKFKHYLSADWSPFKMEDFWKVRVFFFPHVISSSKNSFNNWVVVSFQNDVFVHFFLLIFVVFCRYFIVLLFCIFLGLVKFSELLLVFFCGVGNFASVSEVFRIGFFFRILIFQFLIVIWFFIFFSFLNLFHLLKCSLL